MFHEELSSLFNTAFNFGSTGFGGHEIAALTTAVQLDSIDINAFACQFAVQGHGIGSKFTFQLRAMALRTDLLRVRCGLHGVIGLDLEKPIEHGVMLPLL